MLENKQQRSSSISLLIYAIVSLSILAVIAVVAIALARPTVDNTPLYATIMGFLLPTVTALLAAAIQQLHWSINGRMSELLEVSKTAAHARGIREVGEANEAVVVASTLLKEAATAATKVLDKTVIAKETSVERINDSLLARNS